jgi:hypothetical protein
MTNQIDVDAMIEAVRVQLESQGAELQGLSLDDLRDAMSHPQAAAQVVKLMALEASSVQVGDPAPDFSLSRLGESETSHFGKRPVALIFGSYT